MLENYFNLISVGCQVPKPEVIFSLEQEEPCLLDGEISGQSCPAPSGPAWSCPQKASLCHFQLGSEQDVKVMITPTGVFLLFP
ncbi:zinc finger protein 484-like, partial [Piliocolobus tephrosceles]|uniref:zinc finger protein 484-like n=1 Tax=Piliocolobus tephrosceles TaxID=591936 RepID=UPI000E6B2B57